MTPSRRRVLVMEDEDLLRSMMGEMLRQCGYAADFAVGGSQAIDLFKKARAGGRPYDVVIVDLNVPGGMGGMETFNEIRKIDAAAKVIVTSGHLNLSVLTDFLAHGFSGALAKPFNITDLKRTLDGLFHP